LIINNIYICLNNDRRNKINELRAKSDSLLDVGNLSAKMLRIVLSVDMSARFLKFQLALCLENQLHLCISNAQIINK
jgi:hypothetical protein